MARINRNRNYQTSSPIRSFHKTQAMKHTLGVQESIIPHRIACQIDMSAPCRHLAAMLLAVSRFGKRNMFCAAISNRRSSRGCAIEWLVLA